MDWPVAAVIRRALDRTHFIVLPAVVLTLLWLLSLAAIAKPLWHDEIYTVLLARLPSAGAIWAAHRDGADLEPPMDTLLTHLALRAVGTGPVSTRLPALAGFGVMTLAVATYLRPRAGMTLALVGALIPAQTAAYRYGYEARGYGPLLGFIALALLAWAEAARGRSRRIWLPTLALASAAAMWSHYYAVFGLFALASGEAVRWIMDRRVDRGVLLAFAAGVVLMVPLGALAAVASREAPHFWTRGDTQRVSDVYAALLQPFIGILWSRYGLAIAVVLALSAMSTRVMRDRIPARGTDDPEGGAPHEVAALVVLFAAPLIMLAGAHWFGIPFTTRYGLIVVIATAIGLPTLMHAVAPRGSVAEIGLLLVLMMPLYPALAAPRGAAPNPFADRPLLREALTRERVVASGSLTYLQLWYYAPAELRGRLVYLVDPDRAFRRSGSDTFDRGYVALARWAALPAEPYDQFLAAPREFALYASGTGWLLEDLQAQGAPLELVAAEPGGRLYRISWSQR